MEKIFERTYFLTPAECNPQGRMPITLLINRLIEVATLHANDVGIGYAYLVTRHETWVLSRVGVEMTRYPGVNENYTIRTWMTGINRLFSDRDYEILDGTGKTIGWARTVWAVLDTETRQATDLSHMYHIRELFPGDITCQAAPLTRLRPLTGYTTIPYRFTYCDLDVNRHVNSSRYIELLLNCWSLDFHDRNRLTRFEINYIHEAYYDEPVEVRLSTVTPPGEAIPAETTLAELVHAERPLCRALLAFSPR
ncbi:MAG: acyl-[acyl-carrier-protein] thioesterase [Bacteroidales bacterium]|nr:acyl-[acyl-carrier-protein] thioesterase [Bacteroidales bacterium]